MPHPYVTDRRGRFAWTMQRVSAILLLFLAFWHFIGQHFTESAVSTGLTVTARMNDPWVQSYYAIFVLLALYHGVNGLVGIIKDYSPRPLYTGVASMLLWTLASVFAVIGLSNIISPKSVHEVKDFYALRGFGVGAPSAPTPLTISYDLQQEPAELAMLSFYLQYHVHRSEPDPQPVDEVFDAGDEGGRNGQAFDQWALAQVAEGPVPVSERDMSKIFSNTYEFAVWALQVRQANAESREDEAVRERLAEIPAFTDDLH